jgi:lipoyl(octanoyl) transferase
LPASLGEGTPDSPRLVVDILLAVPLPEGWRLLFLRRRPEQGGFWQGVSGRVEAFDAHLEAAARREIREETGYAHEVEVLDLGRWVEFVSPLSGRSFRKRVLGALLPAHAGPHTIRLSDEHEEARLVTFAEAHALVRFPENRIELADFEAWLSSERPRV